MIWTEITNEPIDPAALMGRVGSSEDGAVALFVGVVRAHNEGRPVSGMDYHGYEAMARDQLQAIAQEAGRTAGVERIAASHRLGSLAVGEVSVAIAVSSPHRGPAFEAARFVIEEIKKRLPVWKKEHYVDRPAQWTPGTVPEPAQRP